MRGANPRPSIDAGKDQVFANAPEVNHPPNKGDWLVKAQVD